MKTPAKVIPYRRVLGEAKPGATARYSTGAVRNVAT